MDNFPTIKFTRHENFIAPDLEWGSKGPNIMDEYGKMKSGNQIELRAHAEYVAHTEKLDAWFCAVTKNPDKEFDERLLDRDVLIDTIGDKTLEKLIISSSQMLEKKFKIKKVKVKINKTAVAKRYGSETVSVSN